MTTSEEWWRKPREIAILVDTPGWFDQHAQRLADEIAKRGDRVCLLRSYVELDQPTIAFYLSCLKIAPPEALAKARVNLVAHASDLPSGRGFSPIVWQILEGASVIPIRLIYADKEVDSGDIVLSDEISLDGHELNDEIRDRLGERIVEMCLRYLDAETPTTGRRQEGEPTWYRRRRPRDSALDPSRTIADQFELLRVVDNDRYPAFFDFRGYRYILKIHKAGKTELDE